MLFKIEHDRRMLSNSAKEINLFGKSRHLPHTSKCQRKTRPTIFEFGQLTAAAAAESEQHLAAFQRTIW